MIKYFLKKIFLLFTLFFVLHSALHASGLKIPESNESLKKCIESEIDPDDTEPLRYKSAFVDLNEDGFSDAVVWLIGRMYCGTGGCPLLICQGTEKGLVLLSTTSVTSEPIRVSQEKKSGWKNLIVYANSVGDVVLSFDGKQYPQNASLEPKASKQQLSDSKTLIKEIKPIP